MKSKKSNVVARERLKLVIIHDRYGNAPDNNMMKLIKRDIMNVISNYVDVDEKDFAVEISRVNAPTGGTGTRLIANIPIVRVKNLGKNC